MDVNGTRFHLLLGFDDWARRCGLAQELASGEGDFSWDQDRSELTLGRRLYTFPSAKQNKVPRLDQRRGAAADAYGNVYWIDGSGSVIFIRAAGNERVSLFWSLAADCATCKESGGFQPLDPPSPQPLQLSGLAITSDHFLVAGTLDPAGLLVFDLQSGGSLRHFLWPAGVAFAPFDMTPSPDGGAVILDRTNGRVWQLDAGLRVVPVVGSAEPAPPFSQFAPTDESGAGASALRRTPITDALALSTGLSDLVAIEVLRDCSLLLMRSRDGDSFSTFHRYAGGVATNETLDTAVARDVVDDPASFAFLGHDCAYVRDRRGVNEARADVLYVAGGSGDQAIALAVEFKPDGTIALEALRELHPMRLFGGKALVPSGGDALYDLDDRWIPLVAQRRGSYAEEGEFTVVFDGKEPACTWHRLFVDACIPPDCSIRVYSRAADDRGLLSVADEFEEPALQRRKGGSELPWTRDVNDTWELLFQRAKGRFLQLRVVLAGNRRTSPHVRAMRVYYPRFSYLHRYMPAVYREDASSAWLLERLLALFEGFFTSIEDRIAAAQCLADVRCAPAETLEWLASWFAVALDPAWDERRRRLFLRHAVDFFTWRGTTPGMIMALRLVTEENPDDSIFDVATTRQCSAVRISERFRRRAIPNVLLQPAAASAGLPVKPRAEQWEPSQGSAELDRRWAEFSDAGRASARPTSYEEFARRTIGFAPRATSADAALWQRYLTRRYASVAELNAAWGTSHASFSEAELPQRPPRMPGALNDWLTFEGIVLPARDAAHRFTVFLPQESLGLPDRQKRIDLASRVVALEKPAHTTFDVQFYWAWFRVGEARLGSDTVVDRGGNAPELIGPVVLDRGYVGSGYLSPEPARASRGRVLLGADCPRKGETQ